ncbi:unnamed protein product [Lathyrus oleraceus]
MWIPFVHDLRQSGEYSWGSDVLAYLYREICKAVDVDVDGIGVGGVILLQTWGFTRFPFIAPISSAVPSHPYASTWVSTNKKKKFSKNPRHYLDGYRVMFDHMSSTNVILV